MRTPVLRFINPGSRIALTVFIFLVSSCTHSAPSVTPALIHVQYSFATQPWLANLNNCAGKDILVSDLHAADFQVPQMADLVIRIGQPAILDTPAYQIGSVDLIVIINAQNPVHELTADQSREIFTGRIQGWRLINDKDTPIHVWVFPAGEDVQQIFEQSVLGGSPVTSQARLANSPDEMSQAISRDSNAIGLLARAWKTNNIVEAFTIASSLPVLAITQSEPQGMMAQIIACLQK